MPATHAGYIFYQTQRKPPLVDQAEGVRTWDQPGKEYVEADIGALPKGMAVGYCPPGGGHGPAIGR